MERYYRGTKVTIRLKTEEELDFILTETNESGFVFQLFCIKGYNAGQIFGYIEEQSKYSSSERAVDKLFLENQLSRNILDFKEIISIVEQ